MEVELIHLASEHHPHDMEPLGAFQFGIDPSSAIEIA